MINKLSTVGFCTGRRQEQEKDRAVSLSFTAVPFCICSSQQCTSCRYIPRAHCDIADLREPDWGFVEIGKLVAMGLLWGVVVLGVIHLSMWLGAWWDNNIGTPGKPGWRSQKIFQ